MERGCHIRGHRENYRIETLDVTGDEVFERLVRDLRAQDPDRRLTLHDVSAAAAAKGIKLEVSVYVRGRVVEPSAEPTSEAIPDKPFDLND